ncbi:GtrA family protein [Thauera sp. SDU_THAU2]|uniref:GtrA family protein n=1 Tax=Thauera sp. SDU_THAU2 TaxID=3136633 RepID=UPI00311FBC04
MNAANPSTSTAAFRRPARFALAGGMATLIHWLCMSALIAAGIDAHVATAAGAITGAAANYPLQRRHAFASRAAHDRALPRYLASCALAWLANLLLFALLHGPAGWPPALAQAGTSGASAALSYLLYARMVFDEAADAQTPA